MYNMLSYILCSILYAFLNTRIPITKKYLVDEKD